MELLVVSYTDINNTLLEISWIIASTPQFLLQKDSVKKSNKAQMSGK